MRLTDGMPLVKTLLIAVAAATALASGAHAQGGSTDIITGRVVGPDSQPVQGVRVEATSVETGVTRSRSTDARGRYTILFVDGGGQYRVTARSLGMSPQTALVVRTADEDRLVQDFTLSSIASVLETVEVSARATPRPGDRAEPGGTQRLLSGEQLQRLPIDPSDPNVIALLQPGVIGVTGSDSTAEGFSIAGQRIDQNLVTLDGLTFGTGTVPQEAIRSTRVITSTYDVARGQFTGGQVATTTRGGTNVLTGSFTYTLRDPNLEFAGDTTQPLSSEYTQHQLSGGVGGPIVRDRLFWFGSFQARRRLDPLRALTLLDARTLDRLGTSADSANRFRDLAAGFGVPLSVPAVPEDRVQDNGTVIGRLDWTMNDDHSLMLRGNWQGSLQRGFRSSALALPSHGGEQETGGGGTMLSVNSVVGRFINEGRGYFATDTRSTDPYIAAPEGQVRVASQLADSSTGISTLSFGGNTGMPTERVSDQLEIADELSWLSESGGHRFRLGGLLNHAGYTSDIETDQQGSFTFNSLEDLEANIPAEFRRSLRGTSRSGGSWNAAVYLGDTWRKSRSFQMTFGLRAEGSAYDGRPQYNPVADSAFGRRTDLFPRDVRVSPRVGFTWQLGFDTLQRAQPARGGGAAGGGGGLRGMLRGRRGTQGAGGGLQPTLIVRGGVGEFRGRAPTQLFQSAMEATGLPSGEQQLVCVGASVPIPDWPSYLADPSTIPDQCAGAPATVSGQRPSVTVFDPGFATPRAIRSSLGVTRRFGPRTALSADYTFALGTSLYGLRDLNLDATTQFTLSAEGNRPVFVPATSIVRRSGATSLLASRRVDTFGQVVEATSRLQSRTHQLTLSMNGVALRNLLWTVSYTTMRSRDQTGFAAGSLAGSGGGRFVGGGLSVAGGGFGTVGAGDPNAFEWGTADLERRHSVLGSFTWLAKPWLDLSGMLRVTSGQPYTPRVSGDINGDGSRNDRAFVFMVTAPDIAGDTALVNGMGRLLDAAPDRVRECLVSQAGRIAARNSCRAEWSPTLDLQANLRPNLPGIGRRLSLVVTAINPLSGLDQLLHGAGNLRGWGQTNRPDATLLYVRGFDDVQQRFIYQVNERFGDNVSTRTAFRSPFMIGLQARLQVGPDRQREMLQGGLAALNNRGRAAPDFRAIVERVSPDPTRLLIRLKDSLRLTDAQVVRIQLVGDTLRVKNSALVDSLTARAATAPDSGDMRSLFPVIQPLLQQARADYLAAIESIREILTPEQWALLPENFRNPRLRRAPGQGPVRPGVRPPP